MSDVILIDGDKVIFFPIFGKAFVTVRPGNLKGTGKTSLNSKAVCVEGDEATVKVRGCLYIALPLYIIPGIGTLTISSLGGDQKAQKTRSRGKALLLKGSKFKAEFTVQSPALRPSLPPVPDLRGLQRGYTGKGAFKTNNDKYKAT